MTTNCRNCVHRPAVYIVWGKLFPPDHLGPRCKLCFHEQNPTIQSRFVEQYAVHRVAEEAEAEYRRGHEDGVRDGSAWQDAGLEAWARWEALRYARTLFEQAHCLSALSDAMSDLATFLSGYDLDTGTVRREES